MLFNRSLESNQIPTIWKCANISPIYKKGRKDEVYVMARKHVFRFAVTWFRICKKVYWSVSEVSTVNHALISPILTHHRLVLWVALLHRFHQLDHHSNHPSPPHSYIPNLKPIFVHARSTPATPSHRIRSLPFLFQNFAHSVTFCFFIFPLFSCLFRGVD